MPWIRGSLWSIEGSVAARGTYRNTVGHSATAARRVTSILTACSPTISMAGSGGAATRRTYRDTVGYSAIVAGWVGTYYPYRLYAYCYAPGVGLPPYRGRTVRGTVRFNPRRSHLDFCAPARVEQSGGLFDQIQSEATLILSGFSGKAGGKAPEGCGPLDSGDSLRTLRSSHSTRHVVACCCRLQLFGGLVVEVWILWG